MISIAVDDAFKTLYLKGAPSEIATSLVQLTLEASLGDLASIEALVGKSMMRGDITPGTVLIYVVVQTMCLFETA